MRFTEEQLERFASPISQTEDQKCKNAIGMVRDAMKKLDYTDDDKEIRTYLADTFSYALDLRQKYTNRKITLFVQGSYANKTNIPSESDVDVAVILESTFIGNYRSGFSADNYNFSSSTDTVSSLKDDVEKALKQHFNYSGVERCDKSIKVVGNTYRVDADVVPAYRYRDYSRDFSFNESNFVGGIEIRPDSGGRIINYPEQHIMSDNAKNKNTKYNFKKCVRIIKNMREIMEENGYIISTNISSFGLESLLWNVDVSEYIRYPNTLKLTLDEVIIFLKNNTSNYYEYMEANGIKMLFTDDLTKNSYITFVNDLSYFYEY